MLEVVTELCRSRRSLSYDSSGFLLLDGRRGFRPRMEWVAVLPSGPAGVQHSWLHHRKPYLQLSSKSCFGDLLGHSRCPGGRGAQAVHKTQRRFLIGLGCFPCALMKRPAQGLAQSEAQPRHLRLRPLPAAPGRWLCQRQAGMTWPLVL